LASTKIKKLVVGLGNPGVEYDGTRHNVGFDIVDSIAQKSKLEFEEVKSGWMDKWLRKGTSPADGERLLGFGRYQSIPFGLMKPLTFMNRSGSAIVPVMRKFGLNPKDILVIVDDLNLPVGALRLRERGSAGGHNGLSDIQDRLSSDNFPRLRVGIGSNFGRGQQSDYVLSKFDDSEQELVLDSIERSRDAALTFIGKGVKIAMNRFNRRIDQKKEDRP